MSDQSPVVRDSKAPFHFSADELKLLSAYVRQKVFQICQHVRSGHIGGSSGAVELLIALYFGGVLRFFPRQPCHAQRDRVLVRGHLGPVRYPMFHLLGWVEEEELLRYRSLGSRLHGHEDHTKLPGVDLTPSGSLGMLLSFGAGAALSARERGEGYRTFVFLGDGEEEEGNVSEAARHAAHLKLANLTVIIDKNGKQLSDPVTETDSSDLAMIWRGYGWNVIPLAEGHDHLAILNAYAQAIAASVETGRPSVIIAETVKGYGLMGAEEHFSGYHTMGTCTPQISQVAIDGLEAVLQAQMETLRELRQVILTKHPEEVDPVSDPFVPVTLAVETTTSTPNHPDHCQAEYFAQLRDACLRHVFQDQRVYFLTADVTRFDQVQQLGLRDFCVYQNTGIREQHTIGLAHGISVSDPAARIIINSFDAFMYRWFDQVNAAVQGGSSMIIIADTAGLTNAQNGRTHQSSGQPGAVLLLPGVIFLEPWDAEDTFQCLNQAIGASRGVVYVRVHSSPIQTSPQSTAVRATTSYVVWEPSAPIALTIVASGFPVGSAIQAAQLLEGEGVGVRVVNLVDHKRSDEVIRPLLEPHKSLLTVYNGNADVLLQNLAKIVCTGDLSQAPSRLYGMGFEKGTTGSFQDLRQEYGLDAAGIIRKIREILV